MEDSCSHLPGNYKGLLEEVEKENITKSSSAAGGGGDDDDHHHVSVDEFNKGENDQRGMIKQAEESSSKLPRPPSPHNKNHSTIIKDQDQQEQVESTKAKMGEVREENERLKLLLSQIVKDYKSLEMRFLDILQQEEAKKSLLETAASHQENKDDEESDDLVSLSLGRISDSQEAKKEEKKSSNNGKELDEKMNHNNNELALGLGCKFELPFAASTAPAAEKDPSSESSFGKAEEEDATEMWPPSKILKTADQRNGDNDQQSSEQMQVKKTRVSIRARCDTPTMNDGCQWRKYGQKIAKGNPCPRAYYRCTVSPTCPVRKQVQRCSEDMSILITTYEGNHNHPLPLSATAMASTTSAAASMLQSQSSSSQPGVGSSVSAAASTSTSSNQRLHGLDINFSQNSRHPYQYYFPNSTVSTSNSHPTITLDLTAPVNSSYFNRLSNAPRYSASSSTTLNFSSSSSNSLERSWNSAGLFNHGAFPNRKNSLSGASNIGGRQPTQEHLYQSYMQTTNETTIPQQALSETITAATKMITSNPSFCSALAAALTSFIGNGGDVPRENLHSGNTAEFRTAPDQNEVGCASSYLARSSPMNSHQQHQKQGSLLLFPSSLPFPTSNETSSGSPADNSNHLK